MDSNTLAMKHADQNVSGEAATLTSVSRLIQASLDDAIRELREDPLERVATAMVLTAAVLIMNSQLGFFATRLFASRSIGLLASTTIVTPLVEELFKHLSIRHKATASYFLTFNVQEFSSYVSLGVRPQVRLPAVGLHLVNTLIQKHYCMRASSVEERDKTRIEAKGYAIAVLLHALFNALSMRR